MSQNCYMKIFSIKICGNVIVVVLFLIVSKESTNITSLVFVAIASQSSSTI